MISLLCLFDLLFDFRNICVWNTFLLCLFSSGFEREIADPTLSRFLLVVAWTESSPFSR